LELLDSIQSTMQKLEDELIQQLKSHVPVAFEIGSHIMNSGGKRIRPQLVIIAARMGGYRGLDAIKLSAAIECIHTATLLHDDVVDHADSRRGRPAANTVWSNEMCVLGGDFILAKAFSTLTSLKNLRILEIVSRTTERLSEGELFQMCNIGNLEMSENDYLRVVTDKTAVLMEAACRGGAILGGLEPPEEEALAGVGLILGIAFQMTDDVIDYLSDKETMGKTPGRDLQEGKLTLPLIRALKEADETEKRRVRKMISDCQFDEGEFGWIRDFIERRGGIGKTLQTSGEYVQKAMQHLEIFPDSEEKTSLMLLSDRVLHRSY